MTAELHIGGPGCDHCGRAFPNLPSSKWRSVAIACNHDGTFNAGDDSSAHARGVKEGRALEQLAIAKKLARIVLELEPSLIATSAVEELCPPSAHSGIVFDLDDDRFDDEEDSE